MERFVQWTHSVLCMFVCVFVCVCLQEHRGLLNIKYPVEVRRELSLDVCQYVQRSWLWYVICGASFLRAAWNSDRLERHGADMDSKSLPGPRE